MIGVRTSVGAAGRERETHVQPPRPSVDTLVQKQIHMNSSIAFLSPSAVILVGCCFFGGGRSKSLCEECRVFTYSPVLLTECAWK